MRILLFIFLEYNENPLENINVVTSIAVENCIACDFIFNTISFTAADQHHQRTAKHLDLPQLHDLRQLLQAYPILPVVSFNK